MLRRKDKHNSDYFFHAINAIIYIIQYIYNFISNKENQEDGGLSKMALASCQNSRRTLLNRRDLQY